MKKTIYIMILALIFTFTGCQQEEVQQTTNSATVPEGGSSISGEILTMYGNEMTLQLALTSITTTPPTVEEDATLPEGEIPEGMPEGEMPEGEMPEGMPEGEMPEGKTERPAMGEGGTRPNMTENTENTENTTQTEQPATNTSTARSGNGTGTGDRGGNMGGSDMSGMSGMSGMGGGMTTELQLSDETEIYLIPIGTPVYQYGSVLSFSQLTAEMTVSVVLNEEGTVVAVTVMGA